MVLAATHNNFLQFKDIELAGFCDIIISRAEEFARRAGSGKAYIDYRTMLDEVKPDMVFVCIPPHCHGQVEFELIERGIPFFVEKPISIHEDLARELNKRVAEKGLSLPSVSVRYDNINDAALTSSNRNRLSLLGIPCRRRSKSNGGATRRSPAVS